MAEVQRPVDTGHHDPDGDRVRLGDLGRYVGVVVVPGRRHVRARVEQHLLHAELPASATPHGCMLSPRTRSSYSVLASRITTSRPSAASAAPSADPPIPPPTITTSRLLMVPHSARGRPIPLDSASVGAMDHPDRRGRRRRPVVLRFSACAETSLSSEASNHPRRGRRSRRPPSSTSARCRASRVRTRSLREHLMTRPRRWPRSPNDCCGRYPIGGNRRRRFPRCAGPKSAPGSDSPNPSSERRERAADQTVRAGAWETFL